MVSWYLGPPGDLRELVTPETGISISEVRYGSAHQGISGTKTMDVTGVKTEFGLEFEYLDEADYRWLQALHTRHIPGPHRLINPLRKNKLSIAAASCNAEPARRPGLSFTGGSWQWQNDWPPGAGIGMRSLRWFSRAANNAARFDSPKLFTVIPGQSLTGSLWIKGTGSFSLNLVFDYYDRYNVSIGSSTLEVVSVTTSWTRFSLTRTIPANAYLANLAMYTAATNEMTFAAPQVEDGAVATTWDQGGRDVQVLIDQMPAESPRYPLMDASITLLET